MQNYCYKEAIRNSTGDIEARESAIWAICKHMIRNESIVTDQQLSLSPETSWCS